MPHTLLNQTSVRSPSPPYRKSCTMLAIALSATLFGGCEVGGDAANDVNGDVTASAAQQASNPSTLLPARIRRLTNAEYDESVKRLLGVDSKYGASFTPDTRQDGYTRNDAQRVDPVFMAQLGDAAQKIADSLKGRVQQLASCNVQQGNAQANEQCARNFLNNFVKKAYRRPPTQKETDALLTVYRAGSTGATYDAGILAVIQAVLQSPSFVYLTELGDGQSRPITLTPYETASALAYLLTGGPPDDQLLQAAQSNQLARGDQRKQQAQRLLQQNTSQPQVTRMVHEWIGIDRIAETAKDSNVYPEFAGLRDAMKREANDFVAETMWKPTGGGVSELLSASWTVAEDGLARMYLGGQAPSRTNNRVNLTNVKRRGVLSQGAFLSVNAHAHESAPVLRGVSVLRRVLCQNIPSPTTLNIDVVPPIPDPTKTTRERFAVHSTDKVCAQCHGRIDAIGFSFEHLDGMGKSRTTENNRPVDSKTKLVLGSDFDGDYADSAAMLTRLAQSPDVRACFARNLFRFASARSGDAVRGAEDAFVASVGSLAAASQGKFSEVLLAFVSADSFVQRGPAQ